MGILDIKTRKELAEFGKEMSAVLLEFKKAIQNWWEVMESYGVTLEKLEEVSVAIGEGAMTRRHGWVKLGLPIEDYPERVGMWELKT